MGKREPFEARNDWNYFNWDIFTTPPLHLTAFKDKEKPYETPLTYLETFCR